MRLIAVFASLIVAAPTALAKPDKELLERALTTLERGTKAGDFEVRAAAIEGLGHGPKKRTLPLVKDALADPQWNVRSAAIDALRVLRDRKWDDEVRKAICDMAVDPELGVLPLIQHLKPHKAAKLIVKGLESKDCPRPDRYVELFVAQGPEWLKPAFDSGLKSRNKELAAEFEKALGELPIGPALMLYKKGFAKYSPELQARLLDRFAAAPVEETKDLAFLKPLLKKSKDDKLRFEIAYVLAMRGDASGKGVLVGALASPDPEKKKKVLTALKPIGDDAIYELMKPIIKDRETPYDQLILAYDVYLDSGSSKLPSYLAKQLENTDVPQRAAAVHFLGKVKGKAALADLHPLLGSGPEEIRLAACHAIGKLAQRESIPVLRDALAIERSDTMKLAMLKALVAIKDADIIPVVRFYIADRDVEVRRLAVRALASVPDERSAADLEIATRDRQKDIRETAFFALISQDPENRLMLFERSLEWLSPEALTAFVDKHQDRVRHHVVMALGATRDDLRSTAWTLTKKLSKEIQIEVATRIASKNDRQLMRLAALDRLVELEGKAAIEVLERFTKDADEKVRARAIGALARLGHKPAIEALIPTLDDPSERIRVAVAGALLRL